MTEPETRRNLTITDRILLKIIPAALIWFFSLAVLPNYGVLTIRASQQKTYTWLNYIYDNDWNKLQFSFIPEPAGNNVIRAYFTQKAGRFAFAAGNGITSVSEISFRDFLGGTMFSFTGPEIYANFRTNPLVRDFSISGGTAVFSSNSSDITPEDRPFFAMKGTISHGYARFAVFAAAATLLWLLLLSVSLKHTDKLKKCFAVLTDKRTGTAALAAAVISMLCMRLLRRTSKGLRRYFRKARRGRAPATQFCERRSDLRSAGNQNGPQIPLTISCTGIFSALSATRDLFSGFLDA